ncbi:RDD family protein [Helicobacter sp. 12S02634-8]|nr:RDD family protein [Helicobacter sp. 12S02634-8]
MNPPPKKRASLLEILGKIYAFGRFKAFITDLFMIYTPILYIVAYVILGSAEAFLHTQIGIFICVCLYGLISAVFIAVSGQTPGLRYMDLAIIRTQGGKVGFLRALVRFFIWIIGTALLIGLFTPFMRQDRKCLHDFLCDTIIVPKIRQNPAQKP